MSKEFKTEGNQTVTPYLIVASVPEFIKFMQATFQAKVLNRSETPEGRTMHAEIKVGDSKIMMGEPGGEFAPISGSHYVYVEDTDATYEKALKAGATSVMEPADQFYGDRSAGVRDPFGNYWWIATHIEDVSVEEIRRRTQEVFSSGQ